MNDSPYDIVLFGATSFVGKILCRYLVDTYGARADFSWAAAARSAEKLRALKDSLGPTAGALPLIVAEAHDEAALRELCDQARVVISTVGPYDLYGDTLVKVCAETGTDYCDITGEVRWMRRMIDAHENTARDSGARIVHACGFDCIPADMGVWYLQQQAMRRFGEYLSQVRMRLIAASGAFSGGTIATMLNEASAIAADPALVRVLRNPYALCPPGHEKARRQHRVTRAEYDEVLGKWVMPNVMASVDEPVVFRSHALLGHPYGEHFTYNEAAVTGRGATGRLKAQGLTGLGKLFLGAISRPALRGLLQRFVLPAPGEGPSEEAQQKGFYVIRFYGMTDDGKSLAIKVTGDRDPGYGSTAKILAECALCLARDISPTEKGGGFWTTASLFDERLIERLGDRAGVTFEPLAD